MSHISGGFFTIAMPMMARHVSREDIYAPSVVHCIEALKTGTTCINENWLSEDVVGRVVRDVGIRAVLGPMIADIEWAGRGPTTMERRVDPRAGDETFENAVRVIDEWHETENGRITCAVAPAAADGCTEAMWLRCKALADARGLCIHTHLSHLPGENEYMQAAYGKRSVRFLRDLGVLGPDLIGAHCVFIDPDDVEMLAATGARMSHTAQHVPKRAYVPPMPEVYAAGVSVSLGTDWCSNDLLTTMRMAIGIARIQSGDVGVIDAERVLRMATLGGAEALGLEAEIGSLVPGKKGDVIIVDLRTPWSSPLHPDHVAPTLVYNAQGGDVSHVIVDGRVLVRDRVLTTTDERDALAEAQRVANIVWGRAADLLRPEAAPAARSDP
jgi:5-methylthioadenosine/S-adenosylhomocysteine deaminase